jgi:hypothetical protein
VGAGRAVERSIGVGGYLVALVAVALEVGYDGRLPLIGGLAVLGFVGAHLGAGLLLGEWRWLALTLLLWPAVIAGGKIAESIIVAIFWPIGIVPAGLGLFAAGVALRKGFARDGAGRPRWMTPVGAALVAFAAIPLPLSLIEKNRTVRVEGARPIAIDERRGSIEGVGLGQRASRVSAAYGRVRPVPIQAIHTGPLEGRDVVGGPSVQPEGPGHDDTFLRYPRVSFWISGGRVWGVETVDRRARTRRGVGVGDSLSLVEKSYPSFDCDEGNYGSDEPIPFPYCAGRAGRRAYIFFTGDYTKPGTPVVSITLSPRRMD